MKITDEMINRFLCWKLPKDFTPDCGISFDGRKPDQWNAGKGWPVGTNLLTAIQAKAMLEHVLASAVPESASKNSNEALINLLDMLANGMDRIAELEPELVRYMPGLKWMPEKAREELTKHRPSGPSGSST